MGSECASPGGPASAPRARFEARTPTRNFREMENLTDRLMLISFDDSPLAILRRKKEALENAIRVLEEYQDLIGAAEPHSAIAADLTMTRTVELLLQRDLFSHD